MKNNYKANTLFLVLMLFSARAVFAQDDTVTIPNHSFENWSCPSYCDPNSWMSDNQFTYLGGLGPTEVSKATAAAHVHGGAASAKLQTQSIVGNIAPGTMTNGFIDENSQQVFDGSAINYRPYRFKGWFQFAPHASTDTFVVGLQLFHGNTHTTTPIGTADFVTNSTYAAWTHFNLLVNYTVNGVTPDTILIVISSGTGNNSTSGTIAYVDDLSLVNCNNMAVSLTPAAATCTQTNGSIVAAANGGAGPYSYVWSNTATTATISNLTPASYSVVATDSNGCSASASTSVTTANVPFTVALSPHAAACVTSTGSDTASASAGNSPYTYIWSNSATTAIISNLAASTYTVTVTDAHGCSTTASGAVTSVNVPFTVTPSNGTTSCGSNTGTVSVAASGGNSPYSYLWSNSATTSQINNLGAGNYSVVVTDNHTCTTSATAAVTTPSGPSATDAVTDLTCNNINTGSVVVTETGGTTPIIYTWSNGATTQSLNNVAANTYTLTITDQNNCSFTISATVNQPAALTATYVVTDVSCFGGANGAVTVTATGGTGAYTYSWGGSNINNNLSAGNYPLTITDANSCSTTLSATVAQPTALAVIPGQTDVSCNGGTNGAATTQVSGGTSPYQYLWTDNSTLSHIVNLTAGNYAVTVTDDNGCTADTTYTITEPTAIVATVTTTAASSSTAADGSATLSATGGTGAFTYVWTNQATTASITNVASATYCVTVTDAHSCTASACDSVGYTVGIRSIASANINIYPNPANNQLTIETSLANGKFLFSIYTLDGKLAEQKTIAGEKSVVILDRLTEGFYIYQLKDVVTGNMNYGKLQIQR